MKIKTHCSVCGKERIAYKQGDINRLCHSCAANKQHTHLHMDSIGYVSKHPLYYVLRTMKSRCYNKNKKDYLRYGGRGIAVCDEWLSRDGFRAFVKWGMSNGYEKGLQIDRINNNGHYSPDNCRFVSLKDNVRNSSATKLTLRDVNSILYLTRCGFDDTYIGTVFGVKRKAICDIRLGKTWSDVSGITYPGKKVVNEAEETSS